MYLNNEILQNDLIDKVNWAECRAIENGYQLSDLNIQWTDDAEDDHIMILEALNQKLQQTNKGFKKLVFPHE